MNESSLITIGVMIFGFVANAFYIKGVFGTKIAEHDRRINEIVEKTVWRDSCIPRHDEVNRRLKRLETFQNDEIK